jgi:NitT/TauT family transport system substrate-binding protein
MRFVRVVLICFAFLSATQAVAQPDSISVGITNSVTDVGLLIAQKKGFFRDEGLDVTFQVFDSAARMIAPFASGDLDVGSGGASAGLYNAVARGINIRIVADKNSTPPGRGTQPLLVRKDYVDSGRYKTLGDLKGMKIVVSGPGSSSSATLDRLVAKAGLKMSDVEPVFMGFPQTVLAFANKSIDASLLTEPSASLAIRDGSAVRIMNDDEIYPNHQIAVILFSEKFATTRHDVGKRFMRAYLKAVRFYNDGIRDGKLSGAQGDAVIGILVEAGLVKDADLYRTIIANPCDPNGAINVESLKEDLNIFRGEGLIEKPVTVEQTLDLSFVRDALGELGQYIQK